MSDKPSDDEVRRQFADVPLGWFCAGVQTYEELWKQVARAVRFSTASPAEVLARAGHSRDQLDREVASWREFAAKGHPWSLIRSTLAFQRESQLADLIEAHHQLGVALRRMHEPPDTWPEPMQRALNGSGVLPEDHHWPVPALHHVEVLAEALALTEAVIRQLDTERD
jgi:hypothetical protein